jgi:hypothetical protein
MVSVIAALNRTSSRARIDRTRDDLQIRQLAPEHAGGLRERIGAGVPESVVMARPTGVERAYPLRNQADPDRGSR